MRTESSVAGGAAFAAFAASAGTGIGARPLPSSKLPLIFFAKSSRSRTNGVQKAFATMPLSE